MAAVAIKRIGFGQVEPNHLSAQKTGQIYAQLPADSTIARLENGQFAKYDYENGKVAFSGDGEYMLVFNEIKLYDERNQMAKDFALEKVNAVNGEIVPRLFKTNVGDIFTTNCLEGANTSATATYTTTETYDVGDQLGVSATGYLSKAAKASGYTGPVFNIVKVYTMPDGQQGVKLQRIS